MVDLSIAFIKKLGFINLFRITMLASTAILICTLIVQILLPVKVNAQHVDAFVQNAPDNSDNISSDNEPDDSNKHTDYIRAGLFKSAVAIQGKPLADRTIDRIKSELKLQCVMTLNDQLVAYIHIKGGGLKKCVVGDTVNDMFTVVDIDKTKKCVVISVIDHKVTLYM